MRHHVNFPDALPFRVGLFFAAADEDTCVRTKAIDRAVLLERLVHEALHVAFFRNVRRHGQPADLVRHGGRSGGVYVRHHNALRSLRCKALAKRLPDSTSASRDHHNFVFQLHAIRLRIATSTMPVRALPMTGDFDGATAG
jgi:hypothetical protein